MTNKALQRRAKRLAKKFYDDAQALFDHDEMDIETSETAVFQALCDAQGWAEEVTEQELE